jgi:hypothetical protein
MIYIFEGSRNSGKTYISDVCSDVLEIPKFKFKFVDWFRTLNLSGDPSGTHKFALGKELMLLQLNSESIIPSDFILDRGIFTVLTWGVLEERILMEDAKEQLKNIIDLSLLKNCSFLYIKGENPDSIPRNKDEWDSKESLRSEETRICVELMTYASEVNNEIKINFFENTFGEESVEMVLNFIK